VRIAGALLCAAHAGVPAAVPLGPLPGKAVVKCQWADHQHQLAGCFVSGSTGWLRWSTHCCCCGRLGSAVTCDGAAAQETREALGIRLQGAVLIVDEAHNLVDAVNGAHSATLPAEAAAAAAGQLDSYWTRFSTRLGPGLRPWGHDMQLDDSTSRG
jgi:DEAD_2